MASERINVYVCQKCGGKTTTIDVNEGVTPMFLGCRANGEGVCDGRGVSSMYRPEPPYPAPSYEWYRPTRAETQKMSPAMREHINDGGLALRQRTQKTQAGGLSASEVKE